MHLPSESESILSFQGTKEEAAKAGNFKIMSDALNKAVAERQIEDPFIFASDVDEEYFQLLVNCSGAFATKVFLALGGKLGVPEDILDHLNLGLQMKNSSDDATEPCLCEGCVPTDKATTN